MLTLLQQAFPSIYCVSSVDPKATGYALNEDGMWRWHSWGLTTVVNNTISGSYVLANDITGNIDIQASDVSVNLDRHTGSIMIEGHIGNNTGNPSLLNAQVYNGQIVSGNLGVVISGSSCLVNDLNITVGQSGTPIWIEHGSYNRVKGCVLSVPPGKTRRSVFNLFRIR
jgi:hypothetical protein